MEDITTRLRNVELAREELKDANARLDEVRKRREVVVNAMVDYALAAYVEGDPIEKIMDAVEFKEENTTQGRMPKGLMEMLGIDMDSDESRVRSFATWLGNATGERIIEKFAEENGEG